jgi:hypothetical protein
MMVKRTKSSKEPRLGIRKNSLFKAYFWSPDSKKNCMDQVDESRVKEWNMTITVNSS